MATSVQPNLSKIRPKNLQEQFLAVRAMTLNLTKGLSAEDQMLQSMPDVSPVKWHLAHTTWFFETFILQPTLPNYEVFNPEYKFVFNSYYKQLGGHPTRGSRGLMSRPSLDEVHRFRSHVDEAMNELLRDENLPQQIVQLIELGLNHEQQHQELILTDIKHALWCSPLQPQSIADDAAVSSSPLSWIPIEGGIHSVGYAGAGFAFDNECPRHDVLLRPFEIASRAVTNGEYMDFINDGGYAKPTLWLSDGWDAVVTHGWNFPLYWERRDDGSWWNFSTTGNKPVNFAEPVCHLSYFEADAYARWSGKRLPTEEEWEVVATRYPSQGTLLEDEVFHPQAATGSGLQQIFGDVWEWTASPYMPYPGFKPAEGLIGEYNGKFMCNQMVLRGGSCATAASHMRASYRNFFPPHARWQYSGIRLSK